MKLQEEYRTGLSIIDDDHEKLINEGLNIMEDVKENRIYSYGYDYVKEEIFNKLNLFDNYIEKHFYVENKLAEYVNYPARKYLELAHEQIKRTYMLVRHSIVWYIKEDKYFVREFIVDIQKLIIGVFISHFNNYDLPLINYLKKNCSKYEIDYFYNKAIKDYNEYLLQKFNKN